MVVKWHSNYNYPILVALIVTKIVCINKAVNMLKNKCVLFVYLFNAPHIITNCQHDTTGAVTAVPAV